MSVVRLASQQQVRHEEADVERGRPGCGQPGGQHAHAARRGHPARRAEITVQQRAAAVQESSAEVPHRRAHVQVGADGIDLALQPGARAWTRASTRRRRDRLLEALGMPGQPHAVAAQRTEFVLAAGDAVQRDEVRRQVLDLGRGQLPAVDRGPRAGRRCRDPRGR